MIQLKNLENANIKRIDIAQGQIHLIGQKGDEIFQVFINSKTLIDTDIEVFRFPKGDQIGEEP